MDEVPFETASDQLLSGCWHASECESCGAVLYVKGSGVFVPLTPSEEWGDSESDNRQEGGPRHHEVVVARTGRVARVYRLRAPTIGRELTENEAYSASLSADNHSPRGALVGSEDVTLFVGGAQEAISILRTEEGRATEDRKFDLKEARCLKDSYLRLTVDDNVCFC